MSTRTPIGSVERNIEASFEFIRRIVDDPTILDDIPNGSTVVLLPGDDASFADENLRLGLQSVRFGEDVYIRHMANKQS